jgi:hypothetical protein
LLNDFYPVPQGQNLRPTPFMPYLTWAPSAWVLPLKFTGGGLIASGKMMVDSQGNVLGGRQFHRRRPKPRCVVDRQPFQVRTEWQGPVAPDLGITGGGPEGIGFGLAIDAQDNCWATTYGSRAIVKFDKTGKPLSPPGGYTFGGRLGKMQGIIVTPNGDVWALDIGNSQVVYLPKGDPDKVQFFFVNHTSDPLNNPGHLLAPFSIAIDQQNRIWVANGGGDWVTRFPADDPTKVEKF